MSSFVFILFNLTTNLKEDATQIPYPIHPSLLHDPIAKFEFIFQGLKVGFSNKSSKDFGFFSFNHKTTNPACLGCSRVYFNGSMI